MQQLGKQTMQDFNASKQTAFNDVFKFFFQPLCYFAFKIINNRDEAKDIAITALHAIMERHNLFIEFDYLKGYLYTTVANKCKNHLKAHKLITSGINDELPSDDIITNHIIRTELLHEISAESKQLSPLRQKVFQLAFVDGFSNPEIAKQLNITNTMVSTTKQRAIIQLRKILNDKKLMP